ncbi:50S ribosome-binding GTPase [Candidatus Bathyarchaeota archaeon]|nr:50S ribosome-binding GTPase [Candidatus Bathyarchaeota archaeon]
MRTLVYGMQEKYLVFTGRPNCGKSSLVKELSRLNIITGKHAGTTRKVKKYPLNDGLVLVDLPGLGKMVGVSKSFEDKVNDQIIEFLESNTENIVLAVAVLDISTFLEVTWRLEKKGFMSVDVEMVKYLTDILGEFPVVVANKIDKANREEIADNLNEFTNRISKGQPSAVRDNVFTTSLKTGKGVGELKSAIHTKLVAKGYRTPFKIQTQ